MSRRTAFLLVVTIALILAQRSPMAAQSVVIEKIGRGTLELSLRNCPKGNSDRYQKLEQLFRDAGCAADHMSTQAVKGSREYNLICALPGESDESILIGAHFDCSQEGLGVIDNWSGAVLLPALYKTLSNLPRKHTLIFIAFAAEEKGLKGSKAYAQNLKPEDIAKTKAMINLDCLGLNSAAVWVEHSDKMLWDSMVRAAAVTKLPLRGVNLPAIFHFDTEPFSKRGIPVIAIHSATQETLFRPHSPLDSFLSMHYKEYYDTYVLVAAFLAYIDLKLE